MCWALSGERSCGQSVPLPGAPCVDDSLSRTQECREQREAGLADGCPIALQPEREARGWGDKQSLTPTFSVCPQHGYIAGEHFECPTCKKETEVWSRIVGYLRPVQNFNDSKREEYGLRKKFVIRNEQIADEL